MAIIKWKTIVLIFLLILGLLFLVLGFKGESWFKSEPASVDKVVNEIGEEQDQGNVEVEELGKEEIGEEGLEKGELPSEQEIDLVEKTKGIEFFAEYRLERDRTRSQQIEILKEITEDEKTNAETRQEAQMKLMKISNNLDKELELENVIRAKEFKDAVVFIQNDSVTVIVLTKDLTDSDSETITQLIARSTGVSKENIIIIPKS